MKSRTTSIRRLILVAVPSTLLVYVMATARPVHATFPGTNGKIAFNRDFGDAFTINPDGSQQHQIGPPGSTICTTWSPHGSKIVCNVFGNNGPHFHLILQTLSPDRPTTLNFGGCCAKFSEGMNTGQILYENKNSRKHVI